MRFGYRGLPGPIEEIAAEEERAELRAVT
jgi:hypothetical protein